MNRIVELQPGRTIEWSARDRAFIVEHELRLNLENGVLGYNAVAVEPSEKVYPPWRSSSTGGVSFVAEIGTSIAAEIDLSRGWNGYAHIENLVVAREFRRQGLARALVNRAIAWAESMQLAGVFLETQNNNLAACQLYESCGFILQGFDSSLYRGLNDVHSREIALFWYRQACRGPHRSA